jgi:uncharacterized damage-inducible protein DinB
MAERDRLVLTERPAADPEVGRWLAALDDGRSRTRRALAGTTPEELDRAPAGGGNAIGTLLYHVAAIEADWLFVEILEEHRPWPADLFPFDVRDEAGRLTVVRGLSLDEHLARLDEVRRLLVETLEPMSGEEFHRVRALPDYDVAPDWVVHHLLQHEAEHRSQIGVARGAPGD